MSLIFCNNIYVKAITNKGLGVFASKMFKKGELIEKGIIRRIDIDGNKNPYIFSWSPDKDVWGFGSGCSTFYNTSMDPNCKMVRYYDEDRFEIFALCDIDIDIELTHKYVSLDWRECFQDLKKVL